MTKRGSWKANTANPVQPHRKPAPSRTARWVYGLTGTLYGEITIQNGCVEQVNFNDCRMLRVAAFCNAIFAETGNRVRCLKNHDLKNAWTCVPAELFAGWKAR